MFNRKEWMKEYRIKNKECISEKQKEWIKKNEEHCKEYRKEYRNRNLEKEKEQERLYRIKNKEIIKERNDKRKDLYNERRRKRHSENPEHRHKKNKESRLRCKERIKRYGQMYYKEKAKNVDLKHKFGITLEQYNEMFNIQNGCCAICGKDQNEFSKSFAVDHNHQTGKVRGLLCQNCNNMLGHAKDNLEILKKAIKYLEKNDG